LGYIAGVLVGGMFLTADVLRRNFLPAPSVEDSFMEFDQPPVERESAAQSAISRADYH
jgi:hypothetical protein